MMLQHKFTTFPIPKTNCSSSQKLTVGQSVLFCLSYKSIICKRFHQESTRSLSFGIRFTVIKSCVIFFFRLESVVVYFAKLSSIPTFKITVPNYASLRYIRRFRLI